MSDSLGGDLDCYAFDPNIEHEIYIDPAPKALSPHPSSLSSSHTDPFRSSSLSTAKPLTTMRSSVQPAIAPDHAATMPQQNSRRAFAGAATTTITEDADDIFLNVHGPDKQLEAGVVEKGEPQQESRTSVKDTRVPPQQALVEAPPQDQTYVVEHFPPRCPEEEHTIILSRNSAPSSKGNNSKYRCRYCSSTFVGGPQKIRVHLTGERENSTRVLRCKMCPAQVRAELAKRMVKPKDQRNDDGGCGDTSGPAGPNEFLLGLPPRNAEEKHMIVLGRSKTKVAKSSNSRYKCLYCSIKFVGGPQKIRVHLSGLPEGSVKVSRCGKTPPSVVDEMLALRSASTGTDHAKLIVHSEVGAFTNAQRPLLASLPSIQSSSSGAGVGVGAGFMNPEEYIHEKNRQLEQLQELQQNLLQRQAQEYRHTDGECWARQTLQLQLQHIQQHQQHQTSDSRHNVQYRLGLQPEQEQTEQQQQLQPQQPQQQQFSCPKIRNDDMLGSQTINVASISALSSRPVSPPLPIVHRFEQHGGLVDGACPCPPDTEPAHLPASIQQQPPCYVQGTYHPHNCPHNPPDLTSIPPFD